MSRAFRVGLFVVATLLILAGTVFLIGQKRFMFHQTYRLQAEFQNVGGLDNGADVRVGGIHLGSVKYIALPDDPRGKLTVVMDMAESSRKIIRQDSVAAIKTEGMLGDKYVEVSFGSEKAPEIENGATIKGEAPVDFSDAALGVMNQSKTAISALTEDADAMKQSFLLRGFFKKQGYEDPAELKKNRIAQMPSQPSAKEFAYDAKDVFDKPDDAKLKNEKKFDEAGKFLEQNKFREVVIAASTAVGDTDKDRVLTQARAKVVRDYLVQHFKFDDKRVKILGLGKAPKGNETNKIEILVYD